jgi:hypothetical protein
METTEMSFTCTKHKKEEIESRIKQNQFEECNYSSYQIYLNETRYKQLSAGRI